jgi:diguanylate cyclase (GGDEF)-like protein/PAS domain S-box-containing protein
MIAPTIRVLLAEDVAADAELELRELKRAGLRVTPRIVERHDDFVAALREFTPHVILSDFSMPGFDGMEALALAREISPDTPFVFVSGTIGEEYAIRAIKGGATDYVLKNNLVRLPVAVTRALDEAKERGERRRAQAELDVARGRLREREAGLHRAQVMAKLGHVITGADGVFESWSETLPSLIGVEPSQMPKSTREWLDLLHPDDRERMRSASIEAGVKGTRVDIEYRLRRPDGAWMHIQQVIEPMPEQSAAAEPEPWFSTLQDVTERRRAEQLIKLEHAVVSRLADADNASEGLKAVIRAVCETEGWECGRYLRVDDQHGVLRLGDAWSVESPAIERFIAGAGTVTYAPGVGLAGQVWQSGQPLWISDIDKDARVVQQALAHETGLHGAFFFPVTSEGRTIGVLAFNSRNVREPEERLVQAISVIGSQIGQFVMRTKQQARIARLNRVYAVLSGINTLIVRVRDREELLKEACRVAVQAGQFPVAFVALADPRDQLVKAVAWAGDERGLVQLTLPTVGAKGQGKAGLSAQAIEKRVPVIVNDIEADGDAMRYPKEALERGYRSAAALPLVVEGTSIGALVLYSAEAGFFDDEETKLLVELAGDISFALDHIEKEEKVRRLTRVHAVLTGINAAIVRIRDREELFRESCRIAFEAGQLRLAWIGIVDARREEILPVAFSGPEQGLLKIIRLSTSKESERFGMAGRAVRDRVPAVSNDVLGDERARFRKESAQRGFRSFAMIPLIVDGAAFGVLGLHAAEVGFFNQDEMKLVMEIAGNISFALEHIDKEEKVRRLTRVHAVLSGINAAIVRIRDQQELFREACRIVIEHGKFRMTWIGLVDRAAGVVKPVASAGEVGDFFESAPLAVTETKPGGHGLAGRAVRDMKPMISNDVTNDPQRLMREELDERGIKSLAIIPLMIGGEAIGVLALYAAEIGTFDEEEMRLLLELAGDISFALEHIDKTEQLDYLAYYDELTGLANRALFYERVEQLLAAAAPEQRKIALVILDVERFKTINDSLGRQQGDALLKQIAERMSQNDDDSLRVARISADHFAVVGRSAQSEDEVARRVERRMQRVFGPPFRIGDTELRINAKAGIALFPNDGSDPDTLFRNAESALKRAKSQGERYLFYTAQMTERVAEKLALENKLRRALERDEFILHYQPKVDLERRSIVGVEALIRWQSPELGLVPPLQFIPLLEETGLIQQVGSWALKRASLDHRGWVEQGIKAPRVAVNVSPIQLRQRIFVEVIEHAIMEGLAPTAIDLEITESLIMEDIEGNIRKLDAVRALGVNIAIDDFGTGYSSLGYLAKLPVQSLKIDRSFITAMHKDANAMTLVSTIVSLAHSLRLKVVAEGVETEEQAKILRLLKCDEMQGYLFSKPLPTAALVELLRKSP